MNIQVLLTDDHVLFRAGLRTILERSADIDVVAEAGNGREALQLIKTTNPDVVLLDIAMPELNGLETACRMKKEFPHVRTIILSMHSSEEYVLQSLQAGATGYLLKDSSPDDLLTAIRSVAKGDTYLSPAVSKHVVSEYVKRAFHQESGLHSLTSRQKEILQLIAEGNSTKEIGRKLDISPKTVETHRGQVMERLGIRDVTGLVRYAIRVGLIDVS